MGAVYGLSSSLDNYSRTLVLQGEGVGGGKEARASHLLGLGPMLCS